MKNSAIAMEVIRDAMSRILRASNKSKQCNAWYGSEKDRDTILYKKEYIYGSQ